MIPSRPLRRWYPWRRRMYAWVTRQAERWLKPPQEPRVYRADCGERERLLRARLMKGVEREL